MTPEPRQQHLEEKLVALARLFEANDIPYAIGGAIALGFHGTPRATVDIDVNLFWPADRSSDRILELLRTIGNRSESDDPVAEIESRGQIRLLWDSTYVDLFFSHDRLHDSCRDRVQQVDFAGHPIPILSPEDLAVFKIVFNRDKDWRDIEEIMEVQGSGFDSQYVLDWIGQMFESDDSRISRFNQLIRRQTPPPST